MRIVSLNPSASEIIFELGLGSSLVGVSHECNFPTEVNKLEKLSSSSINPHGSQSDIDFQVRETLQTNDSLYQINTERLNDLKPDFIVTQGICDVCSISSSQIEVELKGTLCTLPSSTKIISLIGRTFDGICDDIIMLGNKLNSIISAKNHIDKAREKREILKRQTKYDHRILCLEWIDPYFSAGHWVPEQIELAGFNSAIGQTGDQSRILSADEIVDSDPYAIALICCGYNLEQNLTFSSQLFHDDRLNHLDPFKENRVYSFDADSYFSRPTTRILEGSIQLRSQILGNQI